MQRLVFSLALLLLSTGWVSITKAESVALTKKDLDKNCGVYEGTSYGNTTSSIRLRICETSEVHGQAAMSSRSGDRVHHVEGAWRGDRLTLTDVQLDQKTTSRFCWVEHYARWRATPHPFG